MAVDRPINISKQGNEATVLARCVLFDNAGRLLVIKPDGSLSVNFSDSPNIDAFGRLRVGNPQSLYDIQNQYNNSPLFWEQVETDNSGNVATAHLPNESTVQLTVGATSGDKITHQTKQYFRYQPGKSHLIYMTSVLGARATGITRRVGYFDDDNGIFCEQVATEIRFVRRTKTSGSVVNNAVKQSDWSIDKLDGTGASGLTLDETKAQIFCIDLEWLSAGRVRVGYIIDGVIVVAHEFNSANNLDVPYMTTANLPLRYEIVTGSGASGTNTLKAICSTVISEGGHDPIGIRHSASNGTTEISVTTRRAILSIRPKTQINSITNRGTILPETFDILARTNNAFYEIVYNGALGGTPSWTDRGANSLIEFDVAGTTVTGGEIIDSGYVIAGSQRKGGVTDKDLLSKLVLALDVVGTGQPVLSIVITSMTATTVVAGALTWLELY